MTVKRIIRYAIYFVIYLSFFQCTIFAVENEEYGSFDVEAILPENQIDDQANYFQLLVEPKKRQVIKVKVSNHTDTKQTFLIMINQATTNKNGLLVYDEKKQEVDQNGDIQFSHIAKIKKNEITVARNSEKYAEIELSIPEKSFKGILLGGITISKKNNAEKTSEGVAIKNALSYTIALLLTEDEKVDFYGETDILLRQIRIVSSENKRALQIEIQNPYPEIVRDLSIEGNLYTEGHKKLISERKLDQVKFAPNSTLLFEMELEEKDIKNGTYLFEGTIFGSDKTWDLSEKLTITENGTMADKKEDSPFKWWYLIMPIIGVGLLAIKIYRIRNTD
ncbi:MULTISPECIES: DUF916 domain-containing protein [unclassified Enterococcus]|uniref:DUF916 domain-containing protein n=1 Tax=unclassified Enterococcus TaxID=2608891 RepID=UPI001CE08038|nr:MULTISPECIES: DUF916 domain-containing protein [unclassified Enterococcus]MCA5012420.1 DUF916 domain-containing protein [Enterococcus sp. S23]MCA5015671.1 DUF916 domain-containing protein [Enterococcus sp. S22(2020)]